MKLSLGQQHPATLPAWMKPWFQFDSTIRFMQTLNCGVTTQQNRCSSPLPVCSIWMCKTGYIWSIAGRFMLCGLKVSQTPWLCHLVLIQSLTKPCQQGASHIPSLFLPLFLHLFYFANSGAKWELGFKP